LGFVVTVLLMIVCAAAQSTWPGWLRVQSQAPNLTLAVAICLGLSTGGGSGLTAGFLGAFLWGAVSSSTLGHLFLSHMSLGFFAGSLRGRVFADRVLIAVLLVGVGALLAAVVELVVAPPAGPQPWLTQTLLRALYSAAMAVPIYLLVRSLRRFYPEPETL
jgi:cell shape-determining protein MreD